MQKELGAEVHFALFPEGGDVGAWMGFVTVSKRLRLCKNCSPVKDRRILCCKLDHEIMIGKNYFKNSFKFLERKKLDSKVTTQIFL